MSEPEIARRCTHCGVSLRQSAVFCPQCGEEISVDKITDTPITDVPSTNTVTEAGVIEGAVTETAVREVPDRDVHDRELRDREVPIRENPIPASHASVPTSVAGNVRERVEKIRHVSSVVIDQAAYDPSLRFILVAAVIFVLFLLLLILSKVIG